jgi:hypothetical protein
MHGNEFLESFFSCRTRGQEFKTVLRRWRHGWRFCILPGTRAIWQRKDGCWLRVCVIAPWRWLAKITRKKV